LTIYLRTGQSRSIDLKTESLAELVEGAVTDSDRWTQAALPDQSIRFTYLYQECEGAECAIERRIPR